MLAGFALAALVSTGALWAQEAGQEKKAASDEDKVGQLAQVGPGVSNIKRDAKGRIQSCVVVGQARIPLVLGKAKGLQIARTNARLSCEAEFVRWLRTDVDMHVKNEQETILFLEGKEDNDKNALRESGKSVDKTTQQFKAKSKGLVRGLQVLGVVQDAKDQTLTLVMGWSAQTAAATKQIEAGKGDGVQGGKGGTGPGARSGDRKLQDRKVVSPDLKKFID
jgi:hypothetical protein